MKRYVVVAIVLVLLTSFAVFALNAPKCPIDGSRMMWTGRTTIEWGKLLYLYRCLYGHAYWLTSEQR